MRDGKFGLKKSSRKSLTRLVPMVSQPTLTYKTKEGSLWAIINKPNGFTPRKKNKLKNNNLKIIELCQN